MPCSEVRPILHAPRNEDEKVPRQPLANSRLSRAGSRPKAPKHEMWLQFLNAASKCCGQMKGCAALPVLYSQGNKGKNKQILKVSHKSQNSKTEETTITIFIPVLLQPSARPWMEGRPKTMNVHYWSVIYSPVLRFILYFCFVYNQNNLFDPWQPLQHRLSMILKIIDLKVKPTLHISHCTYLLLFSV